ncbi:MAG: pyridoxamine 5'-phosphate oxidase family protein [Hyphomicrobiales bacterium]
MASDQIKQEYLLQDEDALRACFPKMHPLSGDKVQTTLDEHSRAFIERSPFLCLGTQSKDGSADVSPRGDQPGFVHVLDEKTMVIPERPGNNRLDTLGNIVSNSSVGLLFLVPGFDDTMRVNGTAQISNDPDLLAMMAVKERPALAAIIVTVDEVFIHCAKAFRRSKLWDAASHQDRDELPSIAQIIMQQTNTLPDNPEEIKQIDRDIEEEYKNTLY